MKLGRRRSARSKRRIEKERNRQRRRNKQQDAGAAYLEQREEQLR